MNYRTDLVDEDVAKELIKDQTTEDERLNIKVVELNRTDAKKYNRKPGVYSTINTTAVIQGDVELEEKVTKELVKLIKKSIRSYNLEKVEKIFIVGLGNKNVTPDAIGPIVVEGLIVTNHLEDEFEKKVVALSPGVMGQTGLETADIVKGIVDKFKPDLVIVIDALASRSTKRLFRSIQLATTGISPGSGVKNHRRELSKETLGCEVLAIGVPTVVDIVSILNDFDLESDEIEDNLFLTPKEVDEEVKQTSIIISKAINCALHKLDISMA